MKTRDGREKSLLASAVADLLPALGDLERRKSPYPSTQDPGYGQVLKERFDAVVNDPAGPMAGLLDREACARLSAQDRPIEVSGWGERRDVEMVLQLDGGLRNSRVRLDL